MSMRMCPLECSRLSGDGTVWVVFNDGVFKEALKGDSVRRFLGLVVGFSCFGGKASRDWSSG